MVLKVFGDVNYTRAEIQRLKDDIQLLDPVGVNIIPGNFYTELYMYWDVSLMYCVLFSLLLLFFGGGAFLCLFCIKDQDKIQYIGKR